ncbi:hypothetical protein ACFV4P_28155 [Kitasatospora sp. NPDC059795]|uniref:hypothetical protein n=1 Tax=Kitasatospora sp. NPDC059795 TaxID=3346949 RepID=UPI00365F0F08
MPIKPPDSQNGSSTFDPGQESPALKFGVWGDSDLGAGVIGSSDAPISGTTHVRAAGVVGVNEAAQGVGVEGFCDRGTGVLGVGGADQPGVAGKAATGPGVSGSSTQGPGVTGQGGGTSPGVSGNAAAGPGVSGTSAQGVGVTGTGAGASPGVSGQADSGPGVLGSSAHGVGVAGQGAGASPGVSGQADSGPGVLGTSTHGAGLSGAGTAGPGVSGSSTGAPGVSGSSTSGPGVVGTSPPGPGVAGTSTGGPGVSGTSTGGAGLLGTGAPGVSGMSTNGVGVTGTSAPGPGVSGISTIGTGVSGISDSGAGMRTTSTSGIALDATSWSSIAVEAFSSDGVGIESYCGHPEPGGGGSGSSPDPPNRGPAVRGHSWFGAGVEGLSEYDAGVHAWGSTGLTASGRTLGADISNGLRVNGVIVSAGSARFVIDHPLDPAENTLTHAFVASPEQKNVYDGVVTLDDTGAARVTLPDWFDALNQHFRYQLTPLDAPAPDLHVSARISGNRFSVAGGPPGGVVSWQVTGVRLDKWAQANPVTPVTAKSTEHRGRFLHPTVFDQPAERGIGVPPAPVRNDAPKER